MPLSPRMRKLVTPDAKRIYWPGVLFVFGAILLPFVVTRLSFGVWRTATGYVALLCWLALPIVIPFFALKAGVVRTKTSISFRAHETLRFWVGLVAIECLAIFLAGWAYIFFRSLD